MKKKLFNPITDELKNQGFFPSMIPFIHRYLDSIAPPDHIKDKKKWTKPKVTKLSEEDIYRKQYNKWLEEQEALKGIGKRVLQLRKQYSNDTEFGSHVRRLINDMNEQGKI